MLVAATVATLLTAATATVVLGLEFLGRGIAHQLHITAIAHGLASQLMVEVHKHLVVGDLDHLPLDTHALLGHHRHDGALADMLVVKLAVDVEDLLLQFVHQVGVLDAEGVLGLQGEVKLLALLEVDNVVVETLDERQIHAEDKRIGMLLIKLEHTGLLVAIDHKDLVHEFYIFTCLNFIH